jgi:uncharacterized protein with FMN-binding domain
MKKVIALILSIVVAIAAALDAYFVFFKKEAATATPSSASATSSSTTKSTSSSAVQSSASTSGLKDGTYTGADESFKWGDVQVQITVQNGKITKATALSYPTDNQHSQRINEEAIPTYESKAVSTQSATFTNISGATESWEAFTKSLKDAISQSEA